MFGVTVKLKSEKAKNEMSMSAGTTMRKPDFSNELISRLGLLETSGVESITLTWKLGYGGYKGTFFCGLHWNSKRINSSWGEGKTYLEAVDNAILVNL